MPCRAPTAVRGRLRQERAALAAREQDLEFRERKLAIREREFAVREKELDVRERELVVKEKEYDKLLKRLDEDLEQIVAVKDYYEKSMKEFALEVERKYKEKYKADRAEDMKRLRELDRSIDERLSKLPEKVLESAIALYGATRRSSSKR